MAFFNLESKEIKEAFSDLSKIVRGHEENVESVQLFGSTLTIPISEAKDIDFFISYKGIGFEDFRNSLIEKNESRNIVVENQEGHYRNCPTWEKTTPHTLHLLLYRKGKTHFSEKLLRTMKSSVDVTDKVLGYKS